jgi:hypothetical protein
MPLATSVAPRREAHETAATEPPLRERWLMLRGERVVDAAEFDLGAKKKGQFH